MIVKTAAAVLALLCFCPHANAQLIPNPNQKPMLPREFPDRAVPKPEFVKRCFYQRVTDDGSNKGLIAGIFPPGNQPLRFGALVIQSKLFPVVTTDRGRGLAAVRVSPSPPEDRCKLRPLPTGGGTSSPSVIAPLLIRFLGTRNLRGRELTGDPQNDGSPRQLYHAGGDSGRSGNCLQAVLENRRCVMGGTQGYEYTQSVRSNDFNGADGAAIALDLVPDP